ncbi:flagellar biosynthetic protein FliO [Paenibacillus sp. FJAT-26967]|uniref:flagellar biosynthetic protein FliO n=1 Tax=Paenibacillus sp. FJAT-26967 TaxID=1729690 RepID=UPI000837E15E|nr:flagellar biosynthetic protein FliO [Paenibacillus sp. FJAT-26967]
MKKKAGKLLLVTAGLLVQLPFWSAVCYGNPGPGFQSGQGTPGNGAIDSVLMIGKVIFFLILIIGLFYGIMKVLSKKNSLRPHRTMQSLGGVPLGQNKSIQVVEIGNALYVVGVGDNIQLLEKIADPVEAAQLKDKITAQTQSAMDFVPVGKIFDKIRRKPSAGTVEEEELTPTFQQVFHDKLQQATKRNKHVEEWLQEENEQERLKSNEHK